MQSVTLSLPVGDVEYRVQSRQAEDPMKSLYLSASQGTHSPPSGPVYPALHTQSVSAVLTLGEMLLFGQSVQASEPGVGLYVPVGHAEHSLTFRVYPALHVKSTEDVAVL